MDKQSAANLIADTFDSAFTEDRFRYFIRNLLDEIAEFRDSAWITGHIKASFKEHIKKYKRIGKYTGQDGNKLDVIIVHLRKESALDRARTMQRNFVASYLKTRGKKDAAIVAYFTDNPEDWRFSFVRMEYKQDVTESGKVRVREELTASRYSFLVGKNEPNHTAQEQIIPLLQDDRNNPTIEDLETAFSVEAVTKRFYTDYRRLSERLMEELDGIIEQDEKIKTEFEAKSIDTANFAKKLLGQIVFLYFVQKKGWLGVGKDDKGNFKHWGTGPKNFLRLLFKKKFIDYKNFFNDVLEPLFYIALATERENDYYDRLDCRTPFLNGGLFEPINTYNWQETDILIKDDLFNEIFNTFDRYNFTVREDEPLEKEVAVDPEMLGKVFENLLPENLRKGKGTYNTPREIVHYMCQESLINYIDTAVNTGEVSLARTRATQEKLFGKPDPEQLALKTTGYTSIIPRKDIEDFIRKGEFAVEHDIAKESGTKSYKYQVPASIRNNARALDEKLASIKVCDLAIGSGAFPVGMMHEIVKARNVLTTYLKNKTGRSIYNFKRHCIQESLYGVDIDPGAIDIAKLRLWLSLIVDEEDYHNIQPLPNLDYKIMQGNSLIEDFHGISLDLEKKENENENLFAGDNELDHLIEALHEKQNALFNATHVGDKRQLKEAVEESIVDIFHYELERQKEPYFKELKNIEETSARFPNADDQMEYYTAEKAKLDKKYNFNFEAVENEMREMTRGNKERNFFPWKLYFADVFRENGGFDVVIANPPYVRADSPDDVHAEFRKKLEESNQYKTLYEKWDLFVPFIEKGIILLSKKGNLRYITSNALCTSKYAYKLLDLIQKEYAMNSIDYFEDMEVFDGVGVIPVVVGINKDKSTVSSVLKIIRSKTFDNINREEKITLTKFNELGKNAFRKNFRELDIEVETEELGDICYLSYGLRPNSDERYWKGEFAKDDLISDVQDRIHCKRYVEGKDIDKFVVKKIKFLEWSTERVPHKLVRKTFPELYDRLKILRGRVTGAIYDDSNLICNDSIIVFVRFIDLAGVYNRSIKNSIIKFNTITRSELENISKDYDLKYLLAIINSRFAFYYLNNHRRHRLKNYFYPDDLRKLPIPVITLQDQKPIILIIDQIINQRKSKPDVETRTLEAKIDRIVYGLYGLTEDEIAIVEESARR